jgi:hypothetical protein
MWGILGAIALAGAAGGLVNALLSDNGFVRPKTANGILQPGVLGNLILGAFAAVVTWGMYGPLKDAVILGRQPPGQVAATLTVTALVGAALAGAGGARVITNEIDKRFLRSAGADAAAAEPDPGLASAMVMASPAEAAAKAAAVRAGAADRATAAQVPAPQPPAGQPPAAPPPITQPPLAQPPAVDGQAARTVIADNDKHPAAQG